MTPQAITIREYEEAEVKLDRNQERQFRALVGGNLTLAPGEEDDTWRIKATSFVGTVATPYLRVLIKPKVGTANLFHLLEAAGRGLPLGPELFDYETTGDLIPAFATFFARHAQACLGRGIERQYLITKEMLVTLRGRIDLDGQVSLAGLPVPVACEYDEHTADTALNRLVKGAALRLARFPGVTLTTRQALLQLLVRLEEVGPVSVQDLRVPTSFTRLNERYRVVERLARMVLARSSLLHAAGATAAAVFLVDMNRVFEEFMEARLRHYLRGRLVVQDHVPKRFDVAGAVGMQPDLLFLSLQDKPIYVADSKYKLTATGFGRESDYYQLLAYTTALELPEGLLIYCQHDGTTPPREVFVGQALKRLRTWSVRLDRSVDDVENELQALADHIASRADLRLLPSVPFSTPGFQRTTSQEWGEGATDS